MQAHSKATVITLYTEATIWKEASLSKSHKVVTD